MARPLGITAIVGLLFATEPRVVAQGVGPGGPLVTSYVLEEVFSTPEYPIAWGARVGTPDHPIAVELDPTGPAWVTHFNAPSGSPIMPGDRIGVAEHLLISGDRSWAGWHQEVVGAEFDWDHNPDMTPRGANILAAGELMPLPGFLVQYVSPSLGHGARLQFGFNELPVSTEVTVTTVLVYIGAVPFDGAVSVRQFSTPEPGTGVLWTVAGLALARVRRF